MMLMYKSSTKEESRVLILVVYLSLFRLCMPLPFSISSVRRCPFHQHKFIVPANSPLYFCYVSVSKYNNIYFSQSSISLCYYVCMMFLYVCTFGSISLPKQYFIKEGNCESKTCVCVSM